MLDLFSICSRGEMDRQAQPLGSYPEITDEWNSKFWNLLLPLSHLKVGVINKANQLFGPYSKDLCGVF